MNTNRKASLVLAGLLIIVVALAAAVMLTQRADARGTNLEPAVVTSADGRNPVLYVKRVSRRWYYLELADGSAWALTRCKSDEVTGTSNQTCWWNGNTMGNGEGYSFAVVRGLKHRTVRSTVVLCRDGRPC